MKKLRNICITLWLFLLSCVQLNAACQNESENIFETKNKKAHNTKIDRDHELSYLFNGTDSYIQLNESFDSTFTFCAWIKPENLLKKNMAVVGIPGAFWIRLTTERELQFTQPGIVDNNSEGLLLSNQNWIFVGVVIDFPETKLYVNGKQVGTFRWKQKKKPWQENILIGKDAWQENFHGEMQDINIFRDAISKGEINNLYQKSIEKRRLTEGLVFYHSFNRKKAYFSKGYKFESNQLTFINDSLRGKVGEFNGKDSYVDLGEIPIDNAVTISAWVKQKEFNRDYGAIAALGHAYAFRITTGGALLFTIPQMADIWDTKARIERNEWQHVAVSFKEKVGVSFYLNGEKTNHFPEEKFQAVTKELEIGTNLWNDFFKGHMDDIVVWNRVLSDEEINALPQKNDAYWKANIKLSRTPFWLYILSALIVAMALSLILVYKRRKKAADVREKPDSFQENITKVVLQNLSDSNFSVKEFAEAMLMSKTKLYNEVKNATGKSPKEYIREVRLKEAARLLNESNIPVTEIIYETGFESRAYFNKCFKEKYRFTPSDYRKKHAQTS